MWSAVLLKSSSMRTSPVIGPESQCGGRDVHCMVLNRGHGPGARRHSCLRPKNRWGGDMGWYFEGWRTRSELIEELTRNSRYRQRNGPTILSTCLAHCYRGGVFSGILWSVREQTLQGGAALAEPAKRWIRCDLLSHGGVWGWGVKSFDEPSGPFYYSCPLGYLRMVPVANREWRAGVRTYHRMLKAKRKTRAGISFSVSRRMRQPLIWPTGAQCRQRKRPTRQA